MTLAVSLTACSSSSSGGGKPSVVASDAAGKAAATAQIKANWATLFNSATPHAKAALLLENGASLKPAIGIAARVAAAEKLKESAVVTKVVFTGPSNANVTFNLLATHGSSLLHASQGKAVLQDGQWKVSQVTFCTLVDIGASTIGVKKVPGC